MHSRPLCAASIFVLCLASSCSRNDQQQGAPARYTEASDTSSPPNISLTTAPGVAFDYNYQFNLPDERISATQEAHATACERLGLDHCRITGMSYGVDQNEQVTAELKLKLDPLIARQFGKSAQQQVEANEGKLIQLQIGSSDEGQVIEQATKQKNDASIQIGQLQKELAKTKPGTQARANLLSQIETLQQQEAQQTHAMEASRATLASTPMELHYYGRGGVPGFRGNPVRDAWKTFMTTVVWLVDILLQALAVLIPLGVLMALLVALWRTRPLRAFREWFRGPMEAHEDGND